MSSTEKRIHPQCSTLGRRAFMGSSAAVAAAFMIAPRCVLAASADRGPSQKVNLAFIGCGGKGLKNLHAFLRLPEVNVVALCDVVRERDYSSFYYGGTAGLRPARKIVEEYYADRAVSGKYKGCGYYRDYREMLDTERDIDGVVVSTPDHVHAVAAIAAIKAGKHVYCEKPLTHSIYEARMLTEAARRAGVATQMGNHGHSGEGIRLTVEWIRDGAIGTVREVHGWTGVGGASWTTLEDRPSRRKRVPRGFDWDAWLGPAQKRRYHPAYAPYRWRGWWDFGTGAIGDMACHNLDPAFWALNLGAPSTIEGSSSTLNGETVPRAALYHYEFAAKGDRAAVTLDWYDGGLKPPRPAGLDAGRRVGDNGVYFVGDEGVIMCGGWGGTPRIIPETKMRLYERPEKTIRRVEKGHFQDWIDACKSGGSHVASANFEYGGPLTEMVLLGCVALRTQQKIVWAGENMVAEGVPEADRYIRPEFRSGWSL